MDAWSLSFRIALMVPQPISVVLARSLLSFQCFAKMSSFNGQEDPYITLLRYEIVLSPKIETILRQLGFFSFAIIQEIDLDIHILERDIQFLSKQWKSWKARKIRKDIFIVFYYKTQKKFNLCLESATRLLVRRENGKIIASQVERKPRARFNTNDGQ